MTIVQLPPLQNILTGSVPLAAIVDGRISMTIAPEDQSRPYVVWGIQSSVPENTLSCAPEWDEQVCWVECWADQQPTARKMMQAAVEAVEALGHITYGPWVEYEDQTKMFHWQFLWKSFTNRT